MKCQICCHFYTSIPYFFCSATVRVYTMWVCVCGPSFHISAVSALSPRLLCLARGIRSPRRAGRRSQQDVWRLRWRMKPAWYGPWGLYAWTQTLQRDGVHVFVSTLWLFLSRGSSCFPYKTCNTLVAPIPLLSVWLYSSRGHFLQLFFI